MSTFLQVKIILEEKKKINKKSKEIEDFKNEVDLIEEEEVKKEVELESI